MLFNNQMCYFKFLPFLFILSIQQYFVFYSFFPKREEINYKLKGIEKQENIPHKIYNLLHEINKNCCFIIMFQKENFDILPSFLKIRRIK